MKNCLAQASKKFGALLFGILHIYCIYLYKKDMTYIYLISKSNKPVYVGMSKAPKERLKAHRGDYGKGIKMDILEECSNSIGGEREYFHIERLVKEGHKLDNRKRRFQPKSNNEGKFLFNFYTNELRRKVVAFAFNKKRISTQDFIWDCIKEKYPDLLPDIENKYFK